MILKYHARSQLTLSSECWTLATLVLGLSYESTFALKLTSNHLQTSNKFHALYSGLRFELWTGNGRDSYEVSGSRTKSASVSLPICFATHSVLYTLWISRSCYFTYDHSNPNFTIYLKHRLVTPPLPYRRSDTDSYSPGSRKPNSSAERDRSSPIWSWSIGPVRYGQRHG